MASDQSVHYVPGDSITKRLLSSDQDVSLYAPGGGTDQNVHCVTKWQMTKVFTAKWLVTKWRVTKELTANKWLVTKWLVTKCPLAKWRVLSQVVKEVYCTYINCFSFHLPYIKLQTLREGGCSNFEIDIWNLWKSPSCLRLILPTWEFLCYIEITRQTFLSKFLINFLGNSNIAFIYYCPDREKLLRPKLWEVRDF